MAITNNRLLHAQFRISDAASDSVNGVDVGGLMSSSVQAGFDDIITAGADGFSMPEVDRLTQFARGGVNTQAWTLILDILAGTVDKYWWYERISGESTFRLNTIHDPYIHAASINLAHRGRADCAFSFECWASDVTNTVTSMWETSDAITLVNAASAITYAPGLEILTGNHGAESDIYHITNFSMNIAGQLSRASGDGDVGYTALDIVWGGQPISGSLTIQDSDRFQSLLLAAKSDLKLTVKQAQGATSKALTIKDVIFTSLDSTSNAGPGYTGYTLNWVQNSAQSAGYGYTTNKPFTGDVAGVTIANV
ncbi:MAG: hypothetical protein GY841_04510 [FCB group bacterium]|nr:hypothetical protein [FCB group bacterium]